MKENKISEVFIQNSADTLADTINGLTGAQIVKYCNAYALDFNVNIPITSPDFGKFGSIVPNKRTALFKNLTAFNGNQQFAIIKELCELPVFENNEDVKNLKRKLFSRYSYFSTLPIYLEETSMTGWDRVDRAIEEMTQRIQSADTEEKFQAIGMIGRETLISIAQKIYIKEIHLSTDGTDISKTDAKRMLDSYLKFELKGSSEQAIKYAKSAVDFCNQLTHDRNANKRDATMCLVTVKSIASLIQSIEDKR